jgi:hypothetical protein
VLPLLVQAHEELELLQDQLQDLSYDEFGIDRWTPMWGDRYTSRHYYAHVFSSIEAHPIFNIIWKSR